MEVCDVMASLRERIDVERGCEEREMSRGGFLRDLRFTVKLRS